MAVAGGWRERLGLGRCRSEGMKVLVEQVPGVTYTGDGRSQYAIKTPKSLRGQILDDLDAKAKNRKGSSRT